MIIRRLTDTDFYIFTMMQAALHHYPAAWTRFAFKWRNEDKMEIKAHMAQFEEELNDELDHLCSLRFRDDELHYLSKIPFFKRDFIEYLRLFQLNRAYIHAYTVNDSLRINIEGPLPNVIMFEVPTLAIVSQLYTKHQGQYTINWTREGRDRLNRKMSYLESHLHRDENFKFADFGTRRRAHVDWHDELITQIKEKHGRFLAGTSNVMLAMRHGLRPIGTMAHLWIQIHQQLGPRLIDSQAAALQTWADEYRGELGIALSDTITFDAFLVDFDRYFALLFDGCRHDSGDPVRWGKKLINHYERYRIDPKTKHAVFSDGLTFQVAVDLFRRFSSQINTGFGIGTYLTNDCGFLAPQIVIKNTHCNGMPTAKVSDSPGKGMCEDDEFETYLRKIIREKVDA